MASGKEKVQERGGEEGWNK